MKQVKLGEICEVVSGSTPKTNIAEYWDGDLEWITPAELDDETYIIKESHRKITCAAVQKTGLKPFPKGTVILSSRAPIGKVAIAGKEMYCNQGFKNLICSESVDNRYLYWYLKGHTDYLNALGRGATFKELSKNIVENIEIPLPGLDKQIMYSNILKKCCDIMMVLKQQMTHYELLIKSRFVELFGDPVQNPKGWMKKGLLDMGKCKNGMNFHYADTGIEINCLGVGDFKDLAFIDNTKNLPTISLNEMPAEEYILKDEDIVFVRSNGNKALVGRSLVVYPGAVPTTFSGFCIRYRKTDDSISIPYLLRVLKTDSMRQKMVGRGANIQNLNQQILRTLEIPIPPLELQKQFTLLVEQVDKLKTVTQKSINELQLLFDSLMQKYFG